MGGAPKIRERKRGFKRLGGDGRLPISAYILDLKALSRDLVRGDA